VREAQCVCLVEGRPGGVRPAAVIGACVAEWLPLNAASLPWCAAGRRCPGVTLGGACARNRTCVCTRVCLCVHVELCVLGGCVQPWHVCVVPARRWELCRELTQVRAHI
jgi:hypothetical protein